MNGQGSRVGHMPSSPPPSQISPTKFSKKIFFGNIVPFKWYKYYLWIDFIALDKVDEEGEWFRNLFEDILFWPKS